MRVVVATIFDLDDYVYGALRNGAAGSLLQDAGPRLLVEAIRAASVDDWCLPVSHRTAAAPPHHRGPGPGEPKHRLSAREIEVVQAIARGRTNQEIAGDQFISLSTVKSHVSGIQAELGMRNRVEITAWAWENRIDQPS